MGVVSIILELFFSLLSYFFIDIHIIYQKHTRCTMQKIKKLSVLIIILVLSVVFLVACNSEKDPVNEEKNNISYLQSSFYHGKSPNFEVKISCGKSEVLFIADGKTNECKTFSTITVIPCSVDLYNHEYTFTLTGDKGETGGTLVKDSFGAYYQADIDLSQIGKVISVKLTYSNKNEEIALIDMLDGKIDGMKALEVAQEALKDKLEADNKEREIYIRMINNTNKPESEYFWYVAFIANPTDYYCALVNPGDGKIISIT